MSINDLGQNFPSTALQRGLILKLLAANYPGGLRRLLVSQQILPMYGELSSRYDADLAYLIAEGLMQESVKIIAGIRARSYVCTSKGYRVAQGEEAVAGVEIVG